jgi:hypothetical protein
MFGYHPSRVERLQSVVIPARCNGPMRRATSDQALLEAHRLNFRLPAGDKRVALDLIEAVIPVEQRHVGVATVRSGDAQLAAVHSALMVPSLTALVVRHEQ